MPTYRVKPGYQHGAFGQYGPGDTLELTETEARGFLDKLALVPEAKPEPTPEPEPQEEPDAVIAQDEAWANAILTGTVREVLEHAEAMPSAVKPLLTAERNGQGRVTLIRQLEAMLDDGANE